MKFCVKEANGRYRPVTDRELALAAAALLLPAAPDKWTLTSPDETRSFLRLRFHGLPNEVFGVVFLDTRHRVIAYEELFSGSIDGCSVHPREVVRKVIEHNAAAVILCHNHPSGVAEPSSADLRITARLKDALALIDVRVLDHMIVGEALMRWPAGRRRFASWLAGTMISTASSWTITGTYMLTLLRETRKMTDMTDMIPWAGGPMPVPRGTLVTVQHRDGMLWTCRAGDGAAVDWDSSPACPLAGDIVAYRVVPTCPTTVLSLEEARLVSMFLAGNACPDHFTSEEFHATRKLQRRLADWVRSQ